jgi:hypothetical protein
MFTSGKKTFYTNTLDYFTLDKRTSKLSFFEGKEGYVFDCPFTVENIIDAIKIKGHIVDEVIDFLKEKFFPKIMKIGDNFAILGEGNLKLYQYEVIQANADHGMKFTLHKAISAFIEEYLTIPQLIPADDVPVNDKCFDNVPETNNKDNVLETNNKDNVPETIINDNVPETIINDNVPVLTRDSTVERPLEFDVAKLTFYAGKTHVGFYVADKFYDFPWPFTREQSMSEIEEHKYCVPDEIITKIMRKHYEKISIEETNIKLIAKDNREYLYPYEKINNSHHWRSKTPNWLILFLVQLVKNVADLEKETLENRLDAAISQKNNLLDNTVSQKNSLEDELALVKNKLGYVKDELTLAKNELSNIKDELALAKTKLANEAEKCLPVSLITKIIISKITDSEKAHILNYCKTDEGYLFNWLIKNTESKFTGDLVIGLFKRRFVLPPSKKWEFSISEVNTYSNNVLFDLYYDKIKTTHVFNISLEKGSLLREFIDYVESTGVNNKAKIQSLMNHIIEDKIIATNHKFEIIHILGKIAY